MEIEDIPIKLLHQTLENPLLFGDLMFPLSFSSGFNGLFLTTRSLTSFNQHRRGRKRRPNIHHFANGAIPVLAHVENYWIFTNTYPQLDSTPPASCAISVSNDHH